MNEALLIANGLRGFHFALLILDNNEIRVKERSFVHYYQLDNN